MRVFLDMDGVIADFDRGMERAHGFDLAKLFANQRQPWHYNELVGLTNKQWWAPATTREFWANLPWTSDGHEILRLVLNYWPAECIYILSNPGGQPEAAAGKFDWIRTHLPDFRDRLILTAGKEALATPGAILLDDHDQNVHRFSKAGGEGILIPRRWNDAWRLAQGIPGAMTVPEMLTAIFESIRDDNEPVIKELHSVAAD